MSSRLYYGDILKRRGGSYNRQVRVQFIRYLEARESPGKPGQWFVGLTLKGDKDAERRGQVGRIDQFPEHGYARDE